MANANLKARPPVTERFVTIQQAWRPPHYSSLYATQPLYSKARSTTFASLRLAGVWLENAGFEPGSRVRVHIEHGRLTITAE
ncbi:SymE family type I addiction module toxin [Caballeronia sp. INDeC2]|uniref:SymE family type I addiction module toxin n=1 Tax=Caballeronia sp. INDeC2 TaxID=2921747 RepID=UPI0020277DAD|nr:SymE family type I addiction module toxin [Caballeronia sp. INDeC2]